MNRKSSRYLGNICGMATVVAILLLAAGNVFAFPAGTRNAIDNWITSSQKVPPRVLLAAGNTPPTTSQTGGSNPGGGQSRGGGSGSTWVPNLATSAAAPAAAARGKPAHNSDDRPSPGSSMYDTNK